MTAKTKYWIDLSDYDLETAISLLQSRRFLYVAFMCHQSIEKALKAYLTESSSNAPPYTHSLSHLISKCQLQDLLSNEQSLFLDKL